MSQYVDAQMGFYFFADLLIYYSTDIRSTFGAHVCLQSLVNFGQEKEMREGWVGWEVMLDVAQGTQIWQPIILGVEEL